MNGSHAIDDFLQNLRLALADDIFAKLSLGHYKGAVPDLKKITVRKIELKDGEKLSFVLSYKTRDITKNFAVDEGVRSIGVYLREGFLTATLFTTEKNIVLDKGKIRAEKPTKKTAPSADHDRSKSRAIEADKKYLHDLGITDAKGNVLKTAQDKYRQINRYIEILSPHLEKLVRSGPVRAADMGSGKGYLTFALYDYLKAVLKNDAKVQGVEYRADMVSLCNRIAASNKFSGLSFVEGTIDGYPNEDINLLIALHACDTATDDAIYHGIKSDAALIVVAPCCHKQIRREMEKGSAVKALSPFLRHGIFMERQAEMATDVIRAMLLEYAGYSVKVMEFISLEHTAKNVLIIAEKNPKAKLHDPAVLQKITDVKNHYGIAQHYLEKKIGI